MRRDQVCVSSEDGLESERGSEVAVKSKVTRGGSSRPESVDRPRHGKREGAAAAGFQSKSQDREPGCGARTGLTAGSPTLRSKVRFSPNKTTLASERSVIKSRAFGEASRNNIARTPTRRVHTIGMRSALLAPRRRWLCKTRTTTSRCGTQESKTMAPRALPPSEDEDGASAP